LLQRSGLEAEIDRIEYDEFFRRLDIGQQIQTLRAAVHDKHVVGRVESRIESFDASHAEPLVSPKKVSDAQHEYVVRECIHVRRFQ